MVEQVKARGRRPLAMVLALALLPMSLTACAERANVTLHEPGVYKGAVDPLLAQQQNDGSWPDSINSAYGTAMACLVLQMPSNYLPIFQR